MMKGLVLAIHLAVATADLLYPSSPTVAWSAPGSESSAGNGLFLSPDQSTLVGAFRDGSVRMYDPMTGSSIGSFVPDSLGSPIRGFGGVNFVEGVSSPFLVYAVTDAPFGQSTT